MNPAPDAVLQAKVRAIVFENSSLEDSPPISNSDDLFDIGLQSLDCVRILVAVEDDFDIEIPDDLVERKLFSCVENLAAAVQQIQAA